MTTQQTAQPASGSGDVVSALMKALIDRSTPEQLAEMLKAEDGLGGVMKSLIQMPAGKTIDRVEDIWTDQTTQHATAAQVGIGPEQAARGGNAARMTGQYSHNYAPQMGLQKQAELLGEELTRMDGMVKGLVTAQSQTNAILMRVVEQQAQLSKALEGKAAPATVVKSDDNHDGKKDKNDKDNDGKNDDDEDEKSAAIAQEVFKAGMMDGDQGKVMRALMLAKAAKSKALVKSISAFALSKGWDDEDDKNNDGKKDKKDDDKESSKSAAPDLVALQTLVEKAMAGQGVLTQTMAGVMEVIRKGASAPPTLVKAIETPTEVAKGGSDGVRSKIVSLHDQGVLTEDERDQAMTLANMSMAVAKGHVPEDVLKHRLQLAPVPVQSIFTQAA